uniref:Uncharacterized protein n=1 Tax=Arundo donax TaxID=35708 RepID=A0A0A9GGU0_ARUDO
MPKQRLLKTRLIGTPAAEEHNRPHPLLSLVRSPLVRRRGQLLGLREAAHVGFGGPVDGPQRVVPAAESCLVLERLHRADAHRHHPRRLRCTGHLLLLRAS